ncbi:hypothetical protein [Nocardia sp. NPDC050793]|uniref:hypothetical protein n=1 Tax=Nocardia sp. NPDC050793 TaxID=3155159 RepID=UPI0033DEE481
MASNLGNLLYGVLLWIRWVGLILIAIVAVGLLISDGAKTKLSPNRIFVVAASALLAAVMIWVTPTLINYARKDANMYVPNYPVGTYQ